MISVRCPHCQVGLKVDETRIPSGITTFKCPKCHRPIPVNLLEKQDNNSETVVLQPLKKYAGKITILATAQTSEQVYPLQEGRNVIGRKSNSPSSATILIDTSDRAMSRAHILIEVKKDEKGGYKHYLSDNNSKNHTLYNSNQLEDGEVVVLSNNDEITIGNTILRFNE